MPVISIKAALDETLEAIETVRVRNSNLIAVFLPDMPPNEYLATYETNLRTLEARVKSIKKLNFNHCTHIFDDPDVAAGKHLMHHVFDVIRSVDGIKSWFDQYFDRLTIQRSYQQILEKLHLIKKRLEELQQTREANNGRERAEAFAAKQLPNTHALPLPASTHSAPVLYPAAPIPNPQTRYHFCPSAALLINGPDKGNISAVAPKELMAENQAKLFEQGGAFLWWNCPGPHPRPGPCGFRIRYHIQGGQNSNVHSTNELRRHDGIALEYTTVFLIKSHLHTLVQTPALPTSKTPVAKYGCLFCYAEGLELISGQSVHATSKSLAAHIVSTHKGTKTPPILVLEKLRVALAGRTARGVPRWDINFTDV